MPIQRNVANGGNSIKHPGEYRVRVVKLETGMSKSQKPMLTVTFQTLDEMQLKGYFCKGLAWHMKNLAVLKECAGLKPDSPAENLHGLEVGILVEPREPDEQGRVFMDIAGFGKAHEVGAVEGGGDFAGRQPGDDSVPF